MSRTDEYGFVVPSAPEEKADLFDQLQGDKDDSEAVELPDGAMADLAEEFRVLRELRLRRDRLNAKAAAASKDYEEQRDRMASAMLLQGTKQFSDVNGQGACTQTTQYQTTVEDPQAFMEWVQERHPELLTVNAQTRTSFIRKEYRDKGVPLDSDQFPPGIKVTERETLSVRGIKAPEEDS